MAGEGHFRQGCEQPAVRAVVIGQRQARFTQVGHDRGEFQQPLRVIEVRRLVTQRAVDLRECRGTETIAATAQINQP